MHRFGAQSQWWRGADGKDPSAILLGENQRRGDEPVPVLLLWLLDGPGAVFQRGKELRSQCLQQNGHPGLLGDPVATFVFVF